MTKKYNPDRPLTDKELVAMGPWKLGLDGLAELAGEEAAAAFRKMGRPPKDNPKRSVKLRIDPEVLDSFKALGKGWHTSINNALKDWAKQHGML